MLTKLLQLYLQTLNIVVKLIKASGQKLSAKTEKEVNPVKWKSLFAVLLGLLMVGVTAESASATAINAPESGKSPWC